MHQDVLSVIEAAYRMDLPEPEWVAGILHAARPSIDQGAGVYAYVFDASAAMTIRSFVFSGPAHMSEAEVGAALSTVPEDYVAKSWRARACSLASEIPGFHELEILPSYLHPRGIRDLFAISGADPTYQGVYLGAGQRRVAKLSPRKRATWSRVAAHLASAFRLRRTIGAQRDLTEGAEAVFTPGGKVEHAEGDASTRAARETLADAVVRLDRARRRTRVHEPERAVEEWRGLVAARWSLLEHFERDGRAYLVARKNEPNAPGIDALTPRERQILAYASLGHSNKLIAYELGISSSTVGVHFLRAARKLRAKTRAQAISSWRKQSGR